MDRFHYEILHTPAGKAMAERVAELIEGHSTLRVASEPWTKPFDPTPAEIYACVLIATDDIAADPSIAAKLQALHKRDLCIIPVVESCMNFVFEAAPHEAITELNTIGIDTPAKLIDSLLHHGGLRQYGSGGQVFISYSRKDGSDLAKAIELELEHAGFQSFLDEREIAGGAHVQNEIETRLPESTLVVLVDSVGASRSKWVDIEIDLARAYHVPVIAVTPETDDFRHHLGVPHVPWGPNDSTPDLALRVANESRRRLAHKETFERRAARTLQQICKLRGWGFETKATPWQLNLQQPPPRVVVCRAEGPSAGAVQELYDLVEQRECRGLLVAGTRPYASKDARAFGRLGGDRVRVVPLPRVASSLSDGLEPKSLAGRRIFLSAALPDDDQCQVANHTLAPFVVVFMQTVLSLGATVVFGGHPSVTPLVHKAIVDIIGPNVGVVELHQAQFWLENDALPKDAEDTRVFAKPRFHGAGVDPVADIAALRDGMIQTGLAGAVFVGGKIKQAIGPKPGIIDEYERFRQACPDKPAFALGLAEGAAATLRSAHVDALITRELARSKDPDLATALIVAGLLG